MPDIRTELADVVKSFVEKKYQAVRQVKITSIKESGPVRGLNFYRVEGTAAVLVGRTPGLQGKRFHITVYATRDGRIVEKMGRVE